MSDARPLDLNNWTDRRRYNDFLRGRDDKIRRSQTHLWAAIRSIVGDPASVEEYLARSKALLIELEDETWPTI